MADPESADTDTTGPSELDIGLPYNILPAHVSMLEDVSDDDEEAAQRAALMAANAIHQLFINNVFDGGDLPTPYKDMLLEVQDALGPTARQQFYQSFGSQANNEYVRQQQDGEGEDEGEGDGEAAGDEDEGEGESG